MKIAFEGDQDGWHYDPNDGVVTLQLQTPDEGGAFEYAPYIRSNDDENYQGVARLFESPDTEATHQRPAAGTFMLFNGSRSMHRVRRVGRTRRPRVVAIFSYDGIRIWCFRRVISIWCEVSRAEDLRIDRFHSTTLIPTTYLTDSSISGGTNISSVFAPWLLSLGQFPAIAISLNRSRVDVVK